MITRSVRIAVTRQFWVMAHRWAGLTIALFLIVAGATGALLPWTEALTFAGWPALSAVGPPSSDARPLDPVTLAERVERQTGAAVAFLPLEVPADHVASFILAARPGQPEPDRDIAWADPYSGAVRLTYRNGRLADGPQNVMPFLYEVHRTLALGAWGTWALGIAALVWTVDCFVGFYLTLPVRCKGIAAIGQASTSWWKRWRPAWTLRKGAGVHKRNIDLHRAGGLWLWPLLLVFAWSAVGFNLPSVHRPVMRALGRQDYFEGASLPKPIETPVIDRRKAVAVGRELMTAEGARRGFRTERAGYLSYDAGTGLYAYSARTSLDWSSKDASTTLWFGGADGRLAQFSPPLGVSGADQTMSWFTMLHMARVFGLPYRIFVSALGLAVVGMSVTGVLIWMRKRSARLLGNRRALRSQDGLPVAAERA